MNIRATTASLALSASLISTAGAVDRIEPGYTEEIRQGSLVVVCVMGNRKIERLRLTKNPVGDVTSAAVVGCATKWADMTYLAKYVKLEELMFAPSQECPFDDKLVAFLAGFPRLRKLSLKNLDAVSPMPLLSHVGRISTLRCFGLLSDRIDAGWLRSLSEEQTLGGISALDISARDNCASMSRTHWDLLGKVLWLEEVSIRLTKPVGAEQLGIMAALGEQPVPKFALLEARSSESSLDLVFKKNPTPGTRGQPPERPKTKHP